MFYSLLEPVMWTSFRGLVLCWSSLGLNKRKFCHTMWFLTCCFSNTFLAFKRSNIFSDGAAILYNLLAFNLVCLLLISILFWTVYQVFGMTWNANNIGFIMIILSRARMGNQFVATGDDTLTSHFFCLFMFK